MKTYLEYPKAHLYTNLKELIALSLDEVKSVQDEIDKVKLENEKIYSENKAEIDEFIENQIANFASMGIDVYKYKKTKNKIERNGYIRWFATNIVDPLTNKWCKMPLTPTAKSSNEVDGNIVIHIAGTMTDLESVYLQAKYQYNDSIKGDEKYTNSVKYAEEHDIEIPTDLDTELVWGYVNEIAMELYLECELPDGKEIWIDCCEECDRFVVGDHRCDCGNVRVSIEVDGDFEKGFYYYTTSC